MCFCQLLDVRPHHSLCIDSHALKTFVTGCVRVHFNLPPVNLCVDRLYCAMHVLQYSLGLVLAIAMIVLLFLLIRPNPSQQAPPESAQPVLFMQGGNNSHEVDDSSSAYNSPGMSS